MAQYHEIQATLNGATPSILFGSYNKPDCIDELLAEREQWKSEGYTGFKFHTSEIEQAQDRSIYDDTAQDDLKELFNIEQ